MTWIRAGSVAAVVIGGAAAGRALARRRSAGSRRTGRPDGQARWHVLTVNRPPAEVAPEGRLPEPLAQLGDTVEVRFRAAPGGRGTEIAVRLRDGEPSGAGRAVAKVKGDDPRWPVRRALRETRMLLETGEVLRPSQPPTTKRTLKSRPLEFATKHGMEEGLL